jgi:RHS repeat-associated protein
MGSVTGLTDSASAVVATYDYDSYGNTLSSTGSVPNPYRFSTKEFSSASGLAYFGARYYNPTTGRWLSPDPMGMVNGPNMYAYCSNNPVNLVDPWGTTFRVVSMPDINGIYRKALAAQKNCLNGLDSPTNIDDPYEILRLAWLRYGDGNFDFDDYTWLIGNLLTDYTGMWGFYIHFFKLIVIDKSVLKKPYLLIASTMLHEIKHYWRAGDREAYLAQNQLIRSHLPGWHGWIGLDIYRPSDW